MFASSKNLRIFRVSLVICLIFVGVKYVFHYFGWELIEQSSLHNSVVSSVTFVIGFLLSATIADYKESERIPSEFASNIEDMFEDAASIHSSYPVFDLEGFRTQLIKIAEGFGKDVRRQSFDVRQEIKQLAGYFSEMEKGKVPSNFVVKLKQQQTLLLKLRHRVSYIQRIRFIPSATILVRSIVVLTLILLLCTNVDPFYGGLAIAGLICFIQVYMLILINVISLPFHAEGKTQDDVSLFLINDTIKYLSKEPVAKISNRKDSRNKRVGSGQTKKNKP